MIEQVSGGSFDFAEWVQIQAWAVGPLRDWAYPLGWTFIGLGAVGFAFVAGARWGSDRATDDRTPAVPAQSLDATALLPAADQTAVLPRVEQSASGRHRRAVRFPLPRRAATTRALSGTTRSITYAPGKAAARR